MRTRGASDAWAGETRDWRRRMRRFQPRCSRARGAKAVYSPPARARIAAEARAARCDVAAVRTRAVSKPPDMRASSAAHAPPRAARPPQPRRTPRLVAHIVLPLRSAAHLSRAASVSPNQTCCRRRLRRARCTHRPRLPAHPRIAASPRAPSTPRAAALRPQTPCANLSTRAGSRAHAVARHPRCPPPPPSAAKHARHAAPPTSRTRAPHRSRQARRDWASPSCALCAHCRRAPSPRRMPNPHSFTARLKRLKDVRRSAAFTPVRNLMCVRAAAAAAPHAHTRTPQPRRPHLAAR